MMGKKIEESESFSGDLGSKFTSEVRRYLFKVLRILTNLGDGYDKRVIVLIDEYDSILWNKNETDTEHQQVEQLVEGFYKTLKNRHDDIKVAIITGTTRLNAKRMHSPMSGNTINLNDAYANIVGYTYNEIRNGFPDCAFEDLYKTLKSTRDDSSLPYIDIIKDEVMKELERWYGGFKFSENSEPVFNTNSVNMCFIDSKFKRYWNDLLNGDFQRGIIKNNIGIFKEFEAKGYIDGVEDSVLTSNQHGCSTDKDKVCATLFQTGLATIKKYRLTEDKTTMFKIGLPNKEVEDSYKKAASIIQRELIKNELAAEISQLGKSFKKKDWSEFIRLVWVLFSSILFGEMKTVYEPTFKYTFHSLMAASGLKIKNEEKTKDGKFMDGFIRYDNTNYIFEYKTKDTYFGPKGEFKGTEQAYVDYFTVLENKDKNDTFIISLNFLRKPTPKEQEPELLNISLSDDKITKVDNIQELLEMSNSEDDNEDINEEESTESYGIKKTKTQRYRDINNLCQGIIAKVQHDGKFDNMTEYISNEDGKPEEVILNITSEDYSSAVEKRNVKNGKKKVTRVTKRDSGNKTK